jgi:hypothetical protein
MILTLDAKCRLNIPAILAPAKPGDQFDATFDVEEHTVNLRGMPKESVGSKYLSGAPSGWTIWHCAAGNFRRSLSCEVADRY